MTRNNGKQHSPSEGKAHKRGAACFREVPTGSASAATRGGCGAKPTGKVLLPRKLYHHISHVHGRGREGDL